MFDMLHKIFSNFMHTDGTLNSVTFLQDFSITISFDKVI